MGKEIARDIGKVIIHDEVIATVAGVAATECYGVVGMASRKLKDGIAELLGRESLSKGVEVYSEGDEVSIKLYLIVGYGVNIPEVAHNIIDKVKYNVEAATGMNVKHIEINVQGVRVAEGN